MTGILSGVKVVEFAIYGMVPATGSVLADWGADVIKVEHPVTGDPVRGLSAYGVPPGTAGVTYLWEIFNRGKRSIGIDLATEAGKGLALSLCEGADVFLTNFLEPARMRLGLDVESVRRRNGSIIYARGSGHGPVGPDSAKGGFDGVSFWARSGVSVAAMPGDYEYPIRLPGPAYGDLQAAMHLAGGVLGALYHRERTGEALTVDTSLLSSGIWAMQATFAAVASLGTDRLPPLDRLHPVNPLANVYRTSDGRFVQMSMLEGDRYWAGFCHAIDRADLIEDPQYNGMAQRQTNAKACVLEIDRAFGQQPLSVWKERLSNQEGPWSVVQTPGEVLTDEQARLNGYLQDLDYPGGARLPFASPPVQFDQAYVPVRAAPELGAHTEEVLLELGLSWDDISALKDSGVTT